LFRLQSFYYSPIISEREAGGSWRFDLFGWEANFSSLWLLIKGLLETDLFMQTMETSIWVTLDPRESSWEVEGVICKIHGRWEAWFAKLILQITPPTSSGRPVGSTSCDSDW
jgi:hypothetical protein